MANISETKNKNKIWKRPSTLPWKEKFNAGKSAKAASKPHFSSTHTPDHLHVHDRREGNVQTVEQGVPEEQDEVLVVGEVDAVVHPRAVMVQLEYAHAANATVVRPVRFDQATLFAEANRRVEGARHDR